MKMKTNKRGRSRLSFNIGVMVGVGSKKVIAGTSRDVSMTGIFINTQDRIPVGEVCGIEILMAGKSSNLRIRARGTVVRHEPDGIGITFQHNLEWWPMLETAIMEEFETAPLTSC